MKIQKKFLGLLMKGLMNLIRQKAIKLNLKNILLNIKMAQSLKVNQYYTARNTLLEQLKEQGYDTSSYASFGINEVNIMIQNSGLDMLLESSKQKVYVRYFEGKLFKPKDIRETLDDLMANNVITKNDCIIFITPDDCNDTIKESIKQLWEEEGIFIISQSIKRLQFNVLKHVLVPPHEIIGDLEVANVMEKYKLKTQSLFPEISRFDPVVLSLGMRPGEICKITRPSKTSIVSDYYRLCVNK
jgi:DNA-directed RNA polymerase subunit H (RpoH/RPB5)